MSDSPTAEKRQPPKKSRIWATLKVLTRTRVMAGLIVVLPIYVTIVVVRFVFEIMRDSSQWVVYGILEGGWMQWLPEGWQFEWQGFTRDELQGSRIQWGIAIFSVFLTVFILYTIGLMTANIVGHRTLALFERIVDRVPLVKTAYRLPKQILASFATHSGDGPKFQRVALVPYPSRETRSIGFITGSCREHETGEEIVSVFVATTPNPTTGFVFLLRRSELIELDWTLEDGFQAMMSAGILMPGVVPFPPHLTAAENDAPKTAGAQSASAASAASRP